MSLNVWFFDTLTGNLPTINLVLVLIGIPFIFLLLSFFLSEISVIRMSFIAFVSNLGFSIFLYYIFLNLLTGFNANLTIYLWKPFLFTIDDLGVIYIALTGIIMLICYFLIYSIKFEKKLFIQCLLLINLLLNLVFTTQDLFAFFISFEAIVIPMFILIGIWGSRFEKVKAGYYFIVYTIGGSITLLLAILYIHNLYGTTLITSMCLKNLPIFAEYFLFLGFFLSFAAKIPMIPFHIWLPLAHVEAPVAGSVLLAGLLIKLGTFGFIKFALPLTPNACLNFAPFVIMLCIISVIYASLSTIRQTDLKRIIAYSSVAHMGVATMSIFTFTKIGIIGSVFLQVAHGLVSSALFILVTILYNHHHTRTILYYRGVALTMPLFSSFFVFFNLCNIGMPLTANFVGEFISLLAGYFYSPWVSVLAATGVILSACYALFLVSRVCYGVPSKHLLKSRDIFKLEYIILVILAFLTLLLGVFPNLIFDILNNSVDEYLTSIYPNK